MGEVGVRILFHKLRSRSGGVEIEVDGQSKPATAIGALFVLLAVTVVGVMPLALMTATSVSVIG